MSRFTKVTWNLFQRVRFFYFFFLGPDKGGSKAPVVAISKAVKITSAPDR